MESWAIMKRVNIVTLGITDIKRSTKFFYDLFGWKPTHQEHEKIVFYDMGGWLLALFPWDALAEDACVPNVGNGFRGITLAHNVPEKNQVSQVLGQAKTHGGEIIKPAQDVFWGGHSGYFKDLDSHLWEVAWNPYTPVLTDGTLKISPENYSFNP